MISYGPNLGLMENANTGEAHDAALRALLRGIDGLVMPNAKGYLTNTPPGSPTDGDLYIVGAAPTGAWAAQGGKVTRWSSVANAWEFYTPKNGWTVQANSAREVYRYTGGSWEIFYQEGTWTVTIFGTKTAGTNTYSNQAGRYIRIGKAIHVVGDVTMTAKDAAMDGDVRLGGQPFSAETSPLASLTVGLWTGITLDPGRTTIAVTVGSSDMAVSESGSAASAATIGVSSLSSSTTIRFSGVYRLA